MANGLVSKADWADIESGTLYVRDRKLLSLIRESDFIDAIYHFWLHKKPNENEKKMLNSVLVSFCGGWSIIPPVVFSARLAATTKAPIAQCLAAGFCASGPAHTSAIQDIMEVYTSKGHDEITPYLEDQLGKGLKIPGFGHPVLKRDPRPAELRKLAQENGINGEAVRKFDLIEETLSREKGIYGNVDGINGAILVDLGFRNPAYGPAFFLMGRTLAMTAHIIEEYANAPFKALDMVYPGFRDMEYGYSLEAEE